MSTFKVNQKAVCVVSQFHSSPGAELAPRPSKDEIVTVIEIMPDGYIELAGYEGFVFDQSCFRPLQELTNYGINDLIEMIPVHEYQTL